MRLSGQETRIVVDECAILTFPGKRKLRLIISNSIGFSCYTFRKNSNVIYKHIIIFMIHIYDAYMQYNLISVEKD